MIGTVWNVRMIGAVAAGLALAAAGVSLRVPVSPVHPPNQALQDIWLYERGTTALSRLTTASDAARNSGGASISGDGRRIVFHSDSDFLKQGIARGVPEIWLNDIPTRQLTRITTASASDRRSVRPAISADGSTIVFQSDSDLLKEGLPRGQTEIWRYDVATRALSRVTRSAAGTASRAAAVNATGSTIAIATTAWFGSDPAVPGTHLWLFDVATGRYTGIAPVAGSDSGAPALSADGRRVAFERDSDIWLFDVPTARLTRVTTSGPSRASEAPSISADGSRIVFFSDADLLGEGRPDSVDEIWLFDVTAGSLARLTSTWVPARDAGTNAVLHPDTQYPRITADGRLVVFASDADFLGEKLPNGYPHVWIYDIATTQLTRVDTSVGSGSGPAINADASSIVLFRTDFDAIRGARVHAPVTPQTPSARPQRLTAAEVGRDLDDFLATIEGRWSYLKANGVDHRAALARIRQHAANGIGLDDYGIEIQKFISRFIDGHSRVSGYRLPPGALPFLIEPSADRFVAIRPDRSALVDPDLPFITAIDGRPLADWIEAARPYAPQGSPQYRVSRALRLMQSVQFHRTIMGLPTPDTLRVELQSADGTRSRAVPMTVVAQSPTGGTWPSAQSRLLADGVGYLRIPSMNSDAVTDIDTWMATFRNTRGIIVDVRGNGGGSREALRALFPYVMAADAPPVVVSAAKYRRHPDFGEDHMGGSRFMFRQSWTGWTQAEREAIARFIPTFSPEWTPAESEFSEWHYLVMSRTTNQKAFAYGKPVVILMDEKCFSATDIFLSAFKGQPGVALVGAPSGGGSALQVPYRMPVSQLSMTLASMASFQRNGHLYDTRGVQPDVVINPDPSYFLRDGVDNMLEQAKRLISSTRGDARHPGPRTDINPHARFPALDRRPGGRS